MNKINIWNYNQKKIKKIKKKLNHSQKIRFFYHNLEKISFSISPDNTIFAFDLHQVIIQLVIIYFF